MASVDVTTFERMQEVVGADAPRNRVESLISGVSRQVEKFLGRSLKQEAFSEEFGVEGCQSVFSVRHSPIQEITRVCNDNEDVDLDLIVFNDHLVTLAYDNVYAFARGPRAMRIEGRGGMAPTTQAFIQMFPDISMECENWLHIRFRRQTNPDLKDLRQDGFGVNVFQSTGMPKSLQELLRSYQRK